MQVMFGRTVTHHNGRMVSPYIQVCMPTVIQHCNNAKHLLAKYTRQFKVVIRHPHKLLPVHIQPSQNSVHALLTFQAVRHGKVRLTAPMVNTVSQCQVVGLRLLTLVRQTHHHAEQAQKPKR